MQFKLSFNEQLSLGMWLSCAVGLGIFSRSMSLTLSTIYMGLIFAIPYVAGRLLRVKNRLVKVIAGIVLIGWVLFFVASVLEASERIYFTHSKNYPTWLTTRSLEPEETLDSLRESECKGRGGMEISQNTNGEYLIRCGFMWHNSKIFTTRNKIFGDR